MLCYVAGARLIGNSGHAGFGVQNVDIRSSSYWKEKTGLWTPPTISASDLPTK
jgi:hypothetical protein